MIRVCGGLAQARDGHEHKRFQMKTFPPCGTCCSTHALIRHNTRYTRTRTQTPLPTPPSSTHIPHIHTQTQTHTHTHTHTNTHASTHTLYPRAHTPLFELLLLGLGVCGQVRDLVFAFGLPSQPLVHLLSLRGCARVHSAFF